MVDYDKFYQDWIKKIAGRTPVEEIERHIQYHALELHDPETSEPKAWAASMQNLLDIYKAIHNVETNRQEQISRLELKYSKEPSTATPPPKQMGEK